MTQLRAGFRHPDGVRLSTEWTGFSNTTRPGGTEDHTPHVYSRSVTYRFR
jgi:hypothetical protein